MKKHKHIIIGLGWLGSPLASYFLNNGDSVAGTTRNIDKASILEQQGISTFLFDIYNSNINNIPADYFQDATLTLNIPPGRKNLNRDLFIAKLKSVIDCALNNGVQHIVFISTTAVFGNIRGEVTNKTALAPLTESGRAHSSIENYLGLMSTRFQIRCDVLRLAGLVDQNRHPVRSLVNRENISLGRDPVNLVHKEDVINCINQLVIRRHITGFYAANLCSTEHPSRKDYYTWCANKLDLPPPAFDKDARLVADGKWINAEDTLRELSFELKFPSPYDMLNP